MSMIDNDWLPAIKGEYSKPYYKELFTFVKDEYSKYVVYPPAQIYRKRCCSGTPFSAGYGRRANGKRGDRHFTGNRFQI